MTVPGTPSVGVARPRRDARTFVTEQLQSILEQRSVRFVAIGFLYVAGAALVFVDSAAPDTAWLLVVPVAISAIAGGLKEGLIIAFASAFLSTFYGVASGGILETEMVGHTIARFPLYGITAVFLGLFAEAHYAVQSNLKHLASTDPLTRVSNVASFYEELGVLEARAVPFAVMLVDIDDLKSINDRYGHQVGSSAIKLVASALRRVVRVSDVVARYGGDEFVVVLHDATRPGTQIVANRIREELATSSIANAPDAEVRVSIGVALYGEDGESSEDLLASADSAMYRDKASHKALR
jgi:diguanylate cyclase (GGDEF)-like protein